MKNSLNQACFVGIACVFLSSISIAQTQPDAGRVTREANPPIAPATSNSKGVVAPNATEVAKPAANAGPLILVKSVSVSGSKAFAESELTALVADLVGKELSLGQIQEATLRITQRYRKAGYLLARAYLPPQKMVEGALLISVLEGNLADVQVENKSRVNDGHVKSVLADIEKGIPAQSKYLDRAVLLLGDTPGVGSVDARLSPGKNVGDTTLITKINPTALWAGRLEADNQGSLYTGRNRLGGSLEANSLFGFGERLTSRLLLSDGSLATGRLGVQMPLGNQGTTFNFGLNRTTYSLGDAFAALDARGKSQSLDVALRHPLIRSIENNVYVQLGWETRKLKDEVRSTSTITEKAAQVANLGLQGDYADSMLQGGFSRWGVTAYSGDLKFDTPSAAALDAAGAKTAGAMHKFVINFDRQQRVAGNFSIGARWRAQFASQNLDSSEKFSLGGPYGVRAYSAGEATGDRGWLANIDFRFALAPTLTVGTFYDRGHSTVNANPYLTTNNSLQRSAAGLAANGSFGQFDWSATLAWRGKEGSTAEPDKRPRLFLMAGWRL
jgi:hemolysin activation/secretion protein